LQQDLGAFAAKTTALLARAQCADGYLNSAIQVSGAPRYARLDTSHEPYCAGHLIHAAVAAARTFDDGALLVVASRFADHLVSRFTGRDDGLDGHPVVETALVELYRQTGLPAYLARTSGDSLYLHQLTPDRGTPQAWPVTCSAWR
jgi:DUF1680 family protein